MRFSWRRKKYISLSSRLSAAHGEISPQGRDDITLEQAQAFIELFFNDDGLYCGDNPYFANVTIGDMLYRWQQSGQISAADAIALRRVYNLP